MCMKVNEKKIVTKILIAHQTYSPCDPYARFMWLREKLHCSLHFCFCCSFFSEKTCEKTTVENGCRSIIITHFLAVSEYDWNRFFLFNLGISIIKLCCACVCFCSAFYINGQNYCILFALCVYPNKKLSE